MAWFHRTIDLWDLFVLVWLAGAVRSSRTVYRETEASRLSHAVPLTAAALLFAPATGRHLHALAVRFVPAAWGAIGFVLALGGIALAIGARLALGRLWSATITLKDGHRLVRTGPFALARHPIYTGLVLAALGTAVALGTFGGFLGLVVGTGALLRKMAIEERLLATRFGDEHAAYRRCVKRLIPFVW